MLIDLLGLYVVVFRLDTTFMGLTVLGIGNALPDALTTIALAKKGYAQVFHLFNFIDGDHRKLRGIIIWITNRIVFFILINELAE